MAESVMTLRLGLCLSKEYTAFAAFTFLSALFTAITQLFLPLVAELSTQRTRAFNLSIMSVGPTLGIFIGRVISGIVADRAGWRNVYWLGLGLQCFVLILLVLFMPEYKALNPRPLRDLLADYPRVLWSIIKLYYKHPTLVQAGMLSFSTFFAVSSFWTTVTFLLSGPAYNYSSSQIGLLGLIGIATMFAAPLCGKYIVQPLREPLLSAIVAKVVSLCGVILGTFLGARSLSGPILQATLLDIGLVILQISNRIALHPLEPQMPNRVNTAFVSVLYLGQLAGTKVGTVVYQSHGGWLPTGGVSIAVIALGFVLIGLRGPNEQRLIGWRGGWKPKQK